MRSAVLTLAGLVALAAIALLDYLTPADVNLGLFYLAVVVAMAWFVGWRSGSLFAVLSAAVELTVDEAFHPDDAAVLAFNALSRLAINGVAVALVHRVNRERGELRQVNSDRATLLRLLAREFPRPLRSIDWFSRTFDDALRANENVHRQFTLVRRHVGELAFLATDVLALGRVHAGELHLERRAVELRELVNQTVADLSDRARIVVSAPDDPLMALADAERLRHALASLLGRCLDAAPHETLRVLLRRSGDEVVIEIRYVGRSVTDDEIEFARLLTVANGGSLRVAQRPGIVDSIVTITFPCTAIAELAGESAATVAAAKRER